MRKWERGEWREEIEKGEITFFDFDNSYKMFPAIEEPNLNESVRQLRIPEASVQLT